MKLLAIDPGCSESAYLLYDGTRPLEFAKVANEAMLDELPRLRDHADLLAVEFVQSYGMAVGQEIFGTVFWAGRFVQRWQQPFRLVFRSEVKLHICRARNAKDANVRQALIDRWGGKEAAIGRKAAPGPLHGVSGDVWSALAVAVTAAETAAAA